MDLEELKKQKISISVEADCEGLIYSHAYGDIDVSIETFVELHGEDIESIMQTKGITLSEDYKESDKAIYEYTIANFEELLKKFYKNDDDIIEDFYGLDKFYEDFGYIYTQEEAEAEEADYRIDDSYWD